ncbi:MAG: acyl-CoA carboxylase subunit beta [Fibrobacter sp.]|nr:acyl-CoA carboxylase subunit beta [Fibrobacter sp.]
MWDKSYLEKLSERNAKAQAGGGAARVEKQHTQGKLTARERLEILFDKGTFKEIGALRVSQSIELPDSKRFYGDGVVTGYGKINGRPVYACSQDFTVSGGSLGSAHAKKICEVMDLALESRVPFISINDGGGARIEEGVCSLDGYSGIFARNTWASGVIPQISVILGPCAGGACYSPAITDFIFMTEKTSQMFITGPGVVKAVTAEVVTPDQLGGAGVHFSKSGVAHFVYQDDKACLEGVRNLLSYLPQNNTEKASEKAGEIVDRSLDIEEIIPDNFKRAYDVRDVIACFADKNSFLEIQPEFAKNVVIGFARLEGNVVGIVANQPKCLAGSLDVDASDKAARFVRFCDSFNIPILTLVDVPGYMPGTKQEHNGIIRHGAKLLFAYAEATVPRVTLILRKAYGGAYIAMNSKNLGADSVFALPIAQIAVMGAEGAVDILHRKEIAAAAEPAKVREQFIADYENKYLNPYIAAGNGFIDEVIEPKNVRDRLVSAFENLKNKKKAVLWKKHGNIPL